MRKTKEITITAEGRDKGNRYLITEMPASQAEEWAWRAFSAIARAGVDIPPNIAEMGMAGIVIVGFNKVFAAHFDDAKPLLDQIMGCVQSVQPALTRALIEDDIEEVATRLLLRSEVFELHTSFSLAAFLSQTWEAAAQSPKVSPESPDVSPSTPTSPETSAPSSQVA